MLGNLTQGVEANSFRPPAVPLVACDPYFSIWSRADRLTDTDTTHWTGKPHRLGGVVRIDGKSFRIMGMENPNIPELAQTGLWVLPTRTIYTFKGAGIVLKLTFMTPALPDDMPGQRSVRRVLRRLFSDRSSTLHRTLRNVFSTICILLLKL